LIKILFKIIKLLVNFRDKTGDILIATKVIQTANEQIGTQTSHELTQKVLIEVKNYYGEAKITGKMFQTANMPQE